jgi:tetratricopeptide (TPR) repeat protein
LAGTLCARLFSIAGIFKKPHLDTTLGIHHGFETAMHLSLRLAALTGLALTLFQFDAQAAISEPTDSYLSGTYLAGRTAGRLRDMDAAIGYVADALKQDPGNIILTERLFMLELSSGDIRGAEELAARVVKFNSQHRMARLVLGLKALGAGAYEEARSHFNESSYTPIGELTASLLSAWTYAGDKNLAGANKELEKLSSNESFADFKSFHEALIADYLNSPLRADTAYRTSFKNAGANLRVAQGFGNFLRRNGKTAEAEQVYRQFLEERERNVLVEDELRTLHTTMKPWPFAASVLDGAGEALFALASAMNDGESVEVALVYAQLATAFGSDKPVMLTLLGDIETDMNRFQAAIDTYEKVPATSPLRANAEIEIALNLQRLEKSQDAQDRLKALIAREPKTYSAWVTLGNILRSTDSFAGAAEAYSKGIALFGEVQKPNWQVYYFRGIAYERLKKWDVAEADFRKALMLAPEEASVLNYLGYSLIDRNLKLDEAIKMVKQAVELRPNDGYIIDSLGWAFFQLGKYDEAVEHLERAVELKAGDPIIAEHLGDCYWKTGRELEARFQWQHAKDNNPEAEDLKRIEEKLRSGMVAEKAVAPKG